MLAIDQRDSLRRALARASGRPPEEIGRSELAATKAAVTEILAPYATAVLVDPVYGLPEAARLVPGSVGLLVASEETGYAPAGADGRQRTSRLIPHWTVRKAKRAGANAVKLLVYYNPDADGEVLQGQQSLVRQIGAECEEEDLPFLLEVVTYPIEEPSADTPEFARRRPGHTIEAAREFSKDVYRVDVLKLEFPGDLKYSKQFCQAVFDERERPALCTLEDLRSRCRELASAAARPWVLLSGGVSIREFLVTLELAVEAGASGFLCGRAIWQDAIPAYPDGGAMRLVLRREGSYNFLRANAVAERACPWFTHPRFGGWDAVSIAGGDEHWYRRY
jgi:tagatose 1,6-diphosphate aldolase